MIKTFLLRCPGCKNFQKYQTSGTLEKKKKKCVYCPKTFSVKDNLIKEI